MRLRLVACAVLVWSLPSLAEDAPTAPDPASISTRVLPEGKDRSLVVRTCAVCHAIEVVVAQRRTEDQWDEVIAKMVDRGAIATEEEQLQILDYLARYFATTNPGP
jgi:cytochrome c5